MINQKKINLKITKRKSSNKVFPDVLLTIWIYFCTMPKGNFSIDYFEIL